MWSVQSQPGNVALKSIDEKYLTRSVDVKQARNQGGGIWGICAPENFKTLQFRHLQELPEKKDEILYSNLF